MTTMNPSWNSILTATSGREKSWPVSVTVLTTVVIKLPTTRLFPPALSPLATPLMLGLLLVPISGPQWHKYLTRYDYCPFALSSDTAQSQWIGEKSLPSGRVMNQHKEVSRYSLFYANTTHTPLPRGRMWICGTYSITPMFVYLCLQTIVFFFSQSPNSLSLELSLFVEMLT